MSREFDKQILNCINILFFKLCDVMSICLFIILVFLIFVLNVLKYLKNNYGIEKLQNERIGSKQ